MWLDSMITERELGSQSELARRLFTSHATVNRWMAGATMPHYSHVAALAHVPQVSPTEVLVALKVPPDLTDSEFAVITELWDAAGGEQRRAIADVGQAPNHCWLEGSQ